MMEKRKYQLYFRFTYVLVALFGVTLALEIGSSTIFNQSFFVYYTNLSNLIGLVFGGFLLYETIGFINRKELKGYSSINPRWHFMIAILLLVTLIIYNTLLGNMFSKDYWQVRNVIMHLVAPSMMVIDFMLFSDKGILKFKDILYSLIMPYIYVGYALLRGLVVGEYPYFFLNATELGYLGVARWVIILTLLFVLLSFIVIGLNKIQYKMNKKYSNN